jgi:uncharacterized membrane protein
MNPVVNEWLNLLVRWAHVIAAIMWIGDSFLFMWLDGQLRKTERKLEGDVVGEIWMAHSGGFYEVIKRKSLAELPPVLHWFKWESYTTWITGFLLLIIVYYLGGAAMLVDPGSSLSHLAAVHVSLALILGSVVLYDLICRTPLASDIRVFGVVALGLIVGATYGIGQVFTPRATFLQVGAMIGTIMASNVFFRIIPAQRHMLAATKEGRPVDTSYGARAKKHSTHNHYVTLPVLFTMLSNHFPTLYANAHAWAVLGLLAVAGVGLKYAMNHRVRTHPLLLAGTVAAFAGVAVLTAPEAVAMDPTLAARPPVSFADGEHDPADSLRHVPLADAVEPVVSRRSPGRDAGHARAHPRVRRPHLPAHGAHQDHAPRQHHGHHRRGARAARRVARAGRGHQRARPRGAADGHEEAGEGLRQPHGGGEGHLRRALRAVPRARGPRRRPLVVRADPEAAQLP